MTGEERPKQSSAPDRASYRTGFAFGTLTFFAVAAIGVISTVVTSRVYGVRIIGQFALVSAPVAALWILSTVKEQRALIKEITGLPARHPRVMQLFAVVFTFSVALTVTMTIIDAVICWFVFRGPLHAPSLLVPTFVSLAGYALVTNTGWNVDSILAAFVAGRQLFWVRLHEVLSFLLIATVLGLVWRSVWGLVIATIGASLTSLVHRVSFAHRFTRVKLTWAEYSLGMQVLPSLLRFGIKATPGQIAQGVSQQGGIWALGMVAPVTLVGAYSRAQTVPQRLQQASMRVTEVLYPTLVGRHTRGDGAGFDRALVDSIRYEVIGMLVMAAVVGGAAHSLLEVFGPGFGRATVALSLLAIFPALASITVTQTQALWAIDRPGLTSVVAVARLVLTVVLLVVLTPAIGITGPAVALLAGYVIVVALNGLALRPGMSSSLRTIWPLRERLALLAAYAGGFAAAHAVELEFKTIPALPLCMAAGTVAYGLIFVALGGINARDRRRLRDAAALLARRTGRGRSSDPPPPAGGEAASSPGVQQELADSIAG
jgi:O-antigen/teichoic acid export membrane protein